MRNAFTLMSVFVTTSNMAPLFFTPPSQVVSKDNTCLSGLTEVIICVGDKVYTLGVPVGGGVKGEVDGAIGLEDGSDVVGREVAMRARSTFLYPIPTFVILCG